ncbi:MAG: tRNA (adenosine(37)-N6)-threonylcarbamoyltransferase complex dimerization subunit type 1 TsaB [Chloroflexota bacterium]|nr:tRNA (adenosine(37)-N6)-threonylcarbamoyltransferase complex dimerization subunit type 1 TsaB [Chloroflexota bacterium]
MILVAIDTSTRYAAIGVMNDTGDRACRRWRSNQNHSRELMPAIAECFTELELESNQTTHVAVAIGPGGFSSVRVGISTALGLITPRKLPVAGIPTHDIEVMPLLSEIKSDTPVYSLIPAGRNQISWTRHSRDAAVETGIADPKELADMVETNALLCGEACEIMKGIVNESQLKTTNLPTRDPNSLIDIAQRLFGAGKATPYEQLRPIYARPPSISQPKRAK